MLLSFYCDGSGNFVVISADASVSSVNFVVTAIDFVV